MTLSPNNPRLLLASIALALGGCSLPLSAETTVVTNTCESDADCNGAGVCQSVAGASVCVADRAELGGIIIQVQTPADTARPSVAHYFPGAVSLLGEFKSGAIATVDLALPPPVHFSGRLASLVGAAETGCTGADGSIPARVELRTASPYLGLTSDFLVDTTLDDESNGYVYDIDVPTGVYDVLIKPLEVPVGCEAHVPPPRLLRSVTIDKDTVFVPEAVELTRLKGTVDIPANVSIEGWHLEIVDPVYGYVVSESPPLTAPVDGTVQIKGGVNGDLDGLAHYPVDSPVVRLRDAEGKLIVHWSLGPLDTDGDGKIKLELADLVANPVSLEASVVDSSDVAKPIVGAPVTIQSIGLTGNAKQNASFRVLATTNEEGVIKVDLVPGKYQVIVNPSNDDDGVATTAEEWEVTENMYCCGKTFALPARPQLKGAVETFAGELVPFVSVGAQPALPDERSYFASALQAGIPLPRPVFVDSDEQGAFSMSLDPGVYDFSVRQAASTGLPWLVLPRLLVSDVKQKAVTDVASLIVPAPAMLHGVISSGEGLVAGAVVRAFVPLSAADGESASVSVIQIGETVTAGDGSYVLPLPPSVALQENASSSE